MNAQLKTLQLSMDSPGVLSITLNRPAAFNALSMEMLSDLHTVFDDLQHPTSMLDALQADFPRVVILSGAGRAFCGGVDIKAADQGIGGSAWDYKDMRSQQLLSRLIEKMRAAPQPIVCAVQGAAAGGGFALAMACDVRVATRGARFSAAFVRLGLTGTDMGTSYFLWRQAGLGVAAEMLLTGRQLAAERAYQLGLVNELVEEPAGLAAAAGKLAQEMLACSRLGLQLTKEQLNSVADGGSLRAALVAENSHQMLLVNNAEASQAAQAWMRSLISKSGGKVYATRLADHRGMRLTPECAHAPATLTLEPYREQEQQHWPTTGRHVQGQATNDTVVVYQAYSPAIAARAAQQGHFLGIPGFSEGRIAWLKTNFCWMMYRSGWGSKEGQQSVLAIHVRRTFFQRLLAASISTRAGTVEKGACSRSEVVLQWDPDHPPDGSKHPGRKAVQLGLRGGLRDEFIGGSQIARVEDITPFVLEMGSRAAAGPSQWHTLLVPAERVLRLDSQAGSDGQGCRWAGLWFTALPLSAAAWQGAH
ncbi:hypothetical protein D9Q98_007292 [Chlorella vulgaris]|uniref:Enoyl-CoA hydratase n=1 Tax=Chlorella vulgaris TaxID=3077 RepID=A0A9D4TLA2_CHLVU|nr:hypothetical protein D9Q98_007292 [Chlorella vulgaris]